MFSFRHSLRAVLIESTMFLTYAFFAANWYVGSKLTHEIAATFNIHEFANATFISNAVTSAKIIGNLFAAFLFIKFKPKLAIAFASFLICIGSIGATLSNTYIVFIIFRFIMGFGGALYVVYFNPIVFKYFSEARRTVINGVNASAYNTGVIIAMLLLPMAVSYFSNWRHTMLFFGLFSLFLLITWLIVSENFDISKTASKSTQEEGSDYSLLDGLKDKFNLIYPATYSGILLLFMSLLTLLPLWKDYPLSAEKINLTLLFSCIVGGVIGTIIASKLEKRLTYMKISGIIMFLSSMLMVNSTKPLLAFIGAIFTGISMLLPIAALLTIPHDIKGMTAKRLTIIMSLFWSVAYLIETILYYVIGVVIDNKGFMVGINLAVLFSLTLFIGSFFLPEKSSKS